VTTKTTPTACRRWENASWHLHRFALTRGTDRKLLDFSMHVQTARMYQPLDEDTRPEGMQWVDELLAATDEVRQSARARGFGDDATRCCFELARALRDALAGRVVDVTDVLRAVELLVDRVVAHEEDKSATPAAAPDDANATAVELLDPVEQAIALVQRDVRDGRDPQSQRSYAKLVGLKSHSTLTRSERWKQVYAAAQAARMRAPLRGTKDANGDLEAVAE